MALAFLKQAQVPIYGAAGAIAGEFLQNFISSKIPMPPSTTMAYAIPAVAFILGGFVANKTGAVVGPMGRGVQIGAAVKVISTLAQGRLDSNFGS